jgi:hypothetical protein
MKAHVGALDKPLTEHLRAYRGFRRLEASTGVHGARAAPEEMAGALGSILRCDEARAAF